MNERSPEELTWQNFFKKCLLGRISSSQFINMIPQMDAKAAPSASAPGILARALIDVASNSQDVDPRISSYFEALLDTKRITVVDLLVATARFPWPSHIIHPIPSSLDGSTVERPTLYATILQLINKKIANGIIDQEAMLFTFLGELLPWMAQHTSSAVLGLLVSTTLGCTMAQEALIGGKAKKLKISLGRRLTPLINDLSATNIQLASALSYYQKQHDMLDESSANPGNSIDMLGGVDLGALSFEDTVMDTGPVITRAGLYIFLNALLCERPLQFNDISVMSFLNARYKSDVPALVTDLILAAFDILANAMYRAEPQRIITILRSFLVNKLPVFLGNYAAVIFPPLSIETCISQALLRIDPNAFPSLSQMFDFSSRNSVVSEARQEFLFSCALHQLIPEGSIELLLGDVPMQSLPASGRYIKSELVSQCTTNPAKIEELIGELENMEGNAGEIAGALFDLRLSDLAGLDRGSFTAQYYRSASESRMMDQLSNHDNDLLGGWIRGLFEAEGINDDLMSTCKPAEFHLLIATLFDQSIKACQVGTLSIETLKGGFECMS
ncbi:MAG: hypothetical protein Q9209_006346 [Squamulea sp. 1 TL-2023]